MDFLSGCVPGGQEKTGVYQDRSGSVMPDGTGGEYRWSAPAGARIVATQFEVKMKNANGINAAPAGPGISLDGGYSHDGAQVTAYWIDRNNPLGWVALQLICHKAGGCENKASSTKAYVEMFDAELTLRDDAAPALSPGGTLWSWADGAWHRGGADVRIDASDFGSGVARIWIEVNGSEKPVGLVLCPGVRSGYAVSTTPCLSSVGGSLSLETGATPFHQGLNQVALCAEDYGTAAGGPNRNCTSARTVMIDSVPPAEPVALGTVGGDDWRAVNGFEFTWSEPPGQVSPLTGGRYRLTDRLTGALIGEGNLAPDSPGRLGPLDAPHPGEFELEVKLRDAAGNLGDPARTGFRFDDRPPGDVAPEEPSGWVSVDELPLEQPVGRAEPGGPSGIGGYALAVSQGSPLAPCPSGICRDPQIALPGGAEDRIATIPNLAEGAHWISAVAASGAAVSSETPGSTLVRVDRTAPRTELDGIPQGWSNRPVTVTATATDELSGMASRPGEDDGEPETVIQAEGFTPHRVPGGSAEFTIITEGRSLVRYWARDLAGNEADGQRSPDGGRHPAPAEAVVRIDTEPPVLAFRRERDPEDPERIELDVRDAASGVADATIAWREAGGEDPFKPLDTRPDGEGRFAARIPSDDLPPGSYELRATATDRAGNSGSGDRTTDGSPMLLRLPLKRETVLTAGFGSDSRSKVTATFSRRPLLAGRLTSVGTGLSNAPVVVSESFAAGSSPELRETELTTDGTGRFALRLAAGPGRTVTVRYAGTPNRSRASSQVLALRTRGRVSFSLRPTRLRNGGRVRMRGRVGRTGALIPAPGKLVTIQYFDPVRRRWRPVEMIRTRPNGVFRYRYRFRTIASAQRIIFRAVAPAEAGWPYLHSTSRARSVIVMPRRTPGARGTR